MPLYAKDVKVNDRRCKVAALKLQGFSHREIGIRIGLGDDDNSEAIVSADLQAVDKVWKTSTMRDFDLDKGRVLAELELLKRELWAEWEKSKRKHVRIRESGGAVVAASAGDVMEAASKLSDDELEAAVAGLTGGAGILGAGADRTLDIEQREGDPRYAKLILEVIDDECELLGLRSKEFGDNTAPPVVTFRIHAPEGATDAAPAALAAPAAEVAP